MAGARLRRWWEPVRRDGRGGRAEVGGGYCTRLLRIAVLLVVAALLPGTATGLGQAGTAEPYEERRRALEELLADVEANVNQVAAAVYGLAPEVQQTDGLEAALDVLERGLERLPAGHGYRPYLLLARVDVLVLLGRHQEAVNGIESMLLELGSNAAVEVVRRALRGKLGYVLLDMGLPDRAAPMIHEAYDFENARVIDPEVQADPGAFLNAAEARIQLFVQSRRHERAIREIERLLDRDDAVFAFDAFPFMRSNFLCLLADIGLTARTDPENLAAGGEWLEQVLADPATLAGTRMLALNLRAYLALLDGRKDDARADTRDVGRLLDEGGDLPVFNRALHSAIDLNLGRGGEASDDLFSDLVDSVSRLETTWATRRPRLGGHGRFHPRVCFIIGEYLRSLSERNGASMAVEALARIQASSSLARLLGAERATLDTIRAELVPPKGAVLVFMPNKNSVLRLRITAHDVDIADIATVGLDEDCRSFARSVGAGRPDATLGRKLARALLPSDLEGRPLVLCGRELLGGLPFEALPTGVDSTLGETSATSYLPSLAVGLALAKRLERQSTPTRALCLVTNARPKPDVQVSGTTTELRLSAGEIEALTVGLPRDHVLVLTGDNASLAGLQGAGLSDFDALHVFAHGVRDMDREIAAGLALTPSGSHDGLLFSEGVLELAAPRRVLLSSCGSGVGPVRDGDAESTHLGGAFLLAGASTVVLADGDVDQVATHRLMARTQRELAAGASVAEALRRARKQISDQGFEHEAALFRAIGLAQ